MAKQLSFSNESREALEKGVNFVANAVKVTIGPKAKNVVIERKFGSPDIVRDGSTVAKEIEIDNPISNLGVKLIEQVVPNSFSTSEYDVSKLLGSSRGNTSPLFENAIKIALQIFNGFNN